MALSLILLTLAAISHAEDTLILFSCSELTTINFEEVMEDI
jgi:hypothetical protein